MLLIADNLTVTNRIIQKALEARNPLPIKEMVERCESAGAGAIDINSGPLPREPEEGMTFLVEVVQSVSDLPILFDTANPKAMEAGLKASRNEAIINGFSLEPAKLEFILPLAKKYNAQVIGYLLDSNGHVPSNGSQRADIAIELYKIFSDAGLDNDLLIIDPVVVPIGWHNGSFQAREVLWTLTHLSELLGFSVQTVAGLSNLTTGGTDIERCLALEGAYLSMLALSGLTMSLMNIFNIETTRLARACMSLTEDKVFTWEGIY